MTADLVDSSTLTTLVVPATLLRRAVQATAPLSDYPDRPGLVVVLPRGQHRIALTGGSPYSIARATVPLAEPVIGRQTEHGLRVVVDAKALTAATSGISLRARDAAAAFLRVGGDELRIELPGRDHVVLPLLAPDRAVPGGSAEHALRTDWDGPAETATLNAVKLARLVKAASALGDVAVSITPHQVNPQVTAVRMWAGGEDGVSWLAVLMGMRTP